MIVLGRPRASAALSPLTPPLSVKRKKDAPSEPAAKKKRHKHSLQKISDVKFFPHPAQARERSPSPVTPSFRSAHCQYSGDEEKKSLQKPARAPSVPASCAAACYKQTQEAQRNSTLKTEGHQILATSGRCKCMQPFVRHSFFQICAFETIVKPLLLLLESRR